MFYLLLILFITINNLIYSSLVEVRPFCLCCLIFTLLPKALLFNHSVSLVPYRQYVYSLNTMNTQKSNSLQWVMLTDNVSLVTSSAPVSATVQTSVSLVSVLVCHLVRLALPPRQVLLNPTCNLWHWLINCKTRLPNHIGEVCRS